MQRLEISQRRHAHTRTVRACAVAAAVLAAVLVPDIASSAERAAKSPQRFTLYSVPTAEQYQNYSDDRQRGYGNNPFGNFKDTTSKIKRSKTGPFPGDLEYFELAVYKDAQLKSRIGTATVTCQFSSNKIAFCNAHYQLNDGVLVGAGLIDFKIPSFAIAIVGGTGSYDGLRGELDATPAAHRAQRLALELYPT